MIKQAVQDSNYSVDEMGKVYSRFGWEMNGSKNSAGYKQIFTYNEGKKTGSYLVHRMVWEAFNGPVPEGYVVDHINRDNSDNRLENLRILTKQQNGLNNGKKGYSKVKDRWIVKMKQHGINKYFGTFKLEEEAAAKAAVVREEYFNSLVSQNQYK